MSLSTKTTWRIGEVIKRVNEGIGGNLDRVGVFLQRYVVNSFGSPAAPGEDGPTTPTGKKNTAKRFRQAQHSKAGEPPFVQTGTLRRSIAFHREGNTVLLIGSSLKPQGNEHSYAWLLEMGSPSGLHPAARPYLRPAVRNNKDLIRKMIAGKA